MSSHRDVTTEQLGRYLAMSLDEVHDARRTVEERQQELVSAHESLRRKVANYDLWAAEVNRRAAAVKPAAPDPVLEPMDRPRAINLRADALTGQ